MGKQLEEKIINTGDRLDKLPLRRLKDCKIIFIKQRKEYLKIF